MSNIWSGKDMATALPVDGFGDFGSLGRKEGNFRSLYGEEATSRPWHLTQPGQPTRMAEEMPLHTEVGDDIDPIEEAARDAFLQGFQEGERLTREVAEADDQARILLAAAIGQIAQAGEGALAGLISQAVVRLVTQIMGEVAIDETLLNERCAAVAACIDGDDAKAVLEVAPDDLPLLQAEGMGVALAANPALSRGSVRLATAEGWVEDGPDVRLDRLRAMLDDMEGR